ncbi:MAG TPA: hypothetical protein VMT99_04025 [Candidatus Paceibacterota bacterium]|nr:hypothetical protein [Candidatus Paceibacterota bacterium]
MKHISGEVGVAAVFLVLLVVVLNPWSLFMPGYVVMGLLTALAVLFGVFASLIWRESGRDEREAFHSMFADRMAFLVGSGILLVAVIVEELAGSIDPWIAAALGGMVVAKVGALIYSKTNL